MFKQILCFCIAVATISFAQAQTADEIIANYLENTGGVDKWKSLKSMKMIGKMSMQGMEFQGAVYEAKPNFQRVEVDVQGMQIVQAYDGETAWMINPMAGNLEPQKMPEEMSEEFTSNEFESEFIDYAKKGHTVELTGEEEVDGVKCHVLKLTKKSGDVESHYFDSENFVPIMIKTSVKTGPAKGQSAETFLSDYQEVDGLMIPFYIETKMNGQSLQKIVVVEAEINPELEANFFTFPKKEVPLEEKKNKN